MRIKVSIIITCYNSEKTISRAIKSTLSQQTDFLYEIIVVNDGSIDKSKQIIRQFGSKIIAIHNRKNKGMMNAFIQGIHLARGNYIAFCDSDDYYIDQHKTQMQANILDNDKSIGICYAAIIKETTDKKTTYKPKHNISYDDLLRHGGLMPENTLMFRKSLFDKYVDLHWFNEHNLKTQDFPICLSLSRISKTYYLDRITSVYTIQDESIANTQNRGKRMKIILMITKLKFVFIFRHGCKPMTIPIVLYKFIKSILSVILKRWNK